MTEKIQIPVKRELPADWKTTVGAVAALHGLELGDLSVQIRDWAEPFLLLGQIENLLRGLIRDNFTVDELRAAKNPGDEARVVNDVANLNFGEYVRLLEPPTAWPKLGVAFHRAPFLRDLRATQKIRNDVMHFDPDPLGAEQLVLLKNVASFLELAARRPGAAQVVAAGSM